MALVHDFLLDLRGAERVFVALCDLYPQADVFTAVYDEQGTEGWFAHRNVNTSFLQRLRPTARTFRALLPLYPYAMEALDLDALRPRHLELERLGARRHRRRPRRCTSATATTRSATRGTRASRRSPAATPLTRAALAVILQRWRQWDWIAAQRVDRYVANSETTARADRALLRPRGDRAAPAGGDRPLHARERRARTTSCCPS